MKKCCLLVRVSTQAQDYQRQINELTDYASSNNMYVVRLFANKVSGASKNTERSEITELLEYVACEKIDLVLCTEISRLGRNTLEALKVIQLLNEHRVPLFVKNYNLTTLDADGKPNAMSQLLITLLLEISSMERDTISQRMRSGYDNFRSKGGKVGRKSGFKKSDAVMKEQYPQEIKLLRKNISLRNVRAITGTSINTLRKLKELL